MIVADRAPLILDATLQPLEPVLRSNLWLIIHVMTINLSYAAFLLALGISDVGLYYIVKGAKADSPMIRDFVDTCYKTLQVGVVLLAAGTISGGVWAEPDEQDAAAKLAELIADPQRRLALGQKAAADIARALNPLAIGRQARAWLGHDLDTGQPRDS